MITMKQYMAVKQAQRQGLTVSAVAIKLGRDRKTVRKYFRMNKDDFHRYLERMAERGKGFEAYRDEILDIYRNHEGRIVYASAVYDFLREKHGDLPGSERTLRNYLAYLKASGLVGNGKGREYRPVEPLPYGKQAQIDFGQETTNIGKIYFAVIILARSRYRYVAAQEKPFTTLDVIGHLLDAFEYFSGIPEELVLDQDRTMLVAENLGDLTTTKAFTDFISEQGLRLWVCRAADPESKGKVENSVKFVKTNFFSSRTFDGFDSLESDLRKWLIRANGRISQATRMIPLADHEAHEKPLLRPLKASIFRSSATSGLRERRKVDQQSLISVAGSKYSVPSSYRLSEVEIECSEGFVRVYDPSTALEVAAHPIATSPGAIITNAAHYSDRKAASEALRDELCARLPDNPEWAAFIDGIWTAYRRYFREHALRLARLFVRPPDPVILSQALAFCHDRGLSTAQELLDAYSTRGGVIEVLKRSPSSSLQSVNGMPREMPIVETRSLADYQRALDAASKRSGDEV
jgi:transposase